MPNPQHPQPLGGSQRRVRGSGAGEKPMRPQPKPEPTPPPFAPQDEPETPPHDPPPGHQPEPDQQIHDGPVYPERARRKKRASPNEVVFDEDEVAK
jgi:hypothetical protein